MPIRSILLTAALLIGVQRVTAEQQGGGAPPQEPSAVITGAARLHEWLPAIAGKNVALVVNHTAVIGTTHLADTLRSLGVNLTKIMAPEHGFRGTADPGEHIRDGVDKRLGLPVISLYGKNKKPTAQQLADTDVLIFDMQDVGTRFFTYISTLHYVMEACAENNKLLVVLDRPNPNGYVDGPVLKPGFESFVGMHPIPVVHGLTIGELARMINGEGWLADGRTCDLKVIPLANWTHDQFYTCPDRPSPNLPDDQSIRLYPSTCFFEGTRISVGRGTPHPFQMLGSPQLKDAGMKFSFTPESSPGMMTNPPYKNETCYGIDLREVPVKRSLDLGYLIMMYKAYPDKAHFFNDYFDKLAGSDVLKEQIVRGVSEAEIRNSWTHDLDAYRETRKKYLLYP